MAKSNSNDSIMTLVKFGLVLGGGYYLIKSSGLKLPSIFPTVGDASNGATAGGSATAASNVSTVPQGSATANSGANTVPGGSATANSATGPASTSQAAALTGEALYKAAAAGEGPAIAAADAAGIRFNADEWSYWREQKTGVVTTVDLFPVGNRAYAMLASEYIASRAAHGLAGLGDILYGERTYFPLPLAYDNNRNPIIPVQIRQMGA